MSRVALLMLAGLSACAHAAEPTGLSEAARSVAASSGRLAAAAEELSERVDRLEAEQRAQAQVLASGGPVLEPAGGVACPGANLCRIDRSYLDKLMSDPKSWVKHARAVPHLEDGTQDGFTLFDIAQGSLPQQLQLENGDTLVVVSGNELTSTDAAVRLLQKLRDARQLEVTYVRNGKRLTLELEIR